MNKQEIFDKVVTHLRKQNNLSVDDTNNRCAYRGMGGLKCAVGCLISDEEYQPEMERKNFDLLISNYPKLFISNLNDDCKLLLKRMQDLHDNNLPDCWENRFKNIAEVFNLTLPEKL